MKSKVTWVQLLDKEGILVDLSSLLVREALDEQGRERGAENPKNKRTAALVTPALIIHGTLSSHLSHHIEIPCV